MLLEKARALWPTPENGCPRLTRRCRAMEWGPLLEAVIAAINPADAALVERLLGHVEEVQQTPRQHPSTGQVCRDEAGEVIHERHFLVDWLHGLKAGSWSLPLRMPRK